MGVFVMSKDKHQIQNSKSQTLPEADVPLAEKFQTPEISILDLKHCNLGFIWSL